MSKLMNCRAVDKPFMASGAITINQTVKLVAGTDPVKVAVAGAGDGIGVAMNNAANGEVVLVMFVGIYPVRRGSSAIAVNNKIISAADGKTAASDTGNILGIALGSPSATDELYPALILPNINLDVS